MGQPSPQDWLIGHTVGNYVVKEKLGEGGMGSVFLAEHPLIGKRVAIKTLHAEFSANEDIVARFFNEARAVNDIQHPNIVDIVDYGTIPASPERPPTVYFVMEFLNGQSLSDVIANEGPLPAERALPIAIQIGDALTASHAKGIVHRDLKPDNVILVSGRRKDFVKVLDFGIAKLTGGAPGSSRTRTGVVMGTPSYMSPEQCEGRGNTDHRTDVYALGILTYEMLTGHVPFEGEGYGDILVKHLTQAPAPLNTLIPTVRPAINAICLRALGKKPDHRYPTMREFVAALSNPEAFVKKHGGAQTFLGAAIAPGAEVLPLTASGKVATPVTNLSSEMRSLDGPSKSRTGLVVGLAAAAMVLGGVGYFALRSPSQKPVVQPSINDKATPVDHDQTEPGPVEPAKDTRAAGTDVIPVKNKAPTPPPVVPTQVTIDIVSTPPGASVLVAGEATPRGVTPLTMHIEKNTDVPITLLLDGYESKQKTLRAAQRRTFDIDLSRERGRRDGRKTDRHPKKPPKNTDGDEDLMAPDF